jgi:zinc transporter 1/2/3
MEPRPVAEMNGHHHHLPPQAKVSFITAMLMGVALSFHSLLEGAALGAQETITNSMHIFIAIVSHKGLAAYALGSSIIESKVEYV